MPRAVRSGDILPTQHRPEREVENLIDEIVEAFPAGPTEVWSVPATPQAWEELTATEDGQFLLRHEGRLYAAIPIDATEVIKQALNR